MDDKQTKTRSPRTPWHCPKAYLRPRAEICPDCRKRLQDNERRYTETREKKSLPKQ